MLLELPIMLLSMIPKKAYYAQNYASDSCGLAISSQL